MNTIFWLLGTPGGLLCLVLLIFLFLGIVALIAGGVYFKKPAPEIPPGVWIKSGHHTQF